MDLLTIIVVIIYLMLVGYLGYQGYRRTKTASDYLVAGRSVHPVVMALSYGATFISTSAIVGFGGVAANFGLGLLWLTFFNIFVGVFIAFVFLGEPIRRMGHHLDAHTFPELMAKRFDSKFIQIFCALVIFLFMPLYAMAVIVGGAEFIVSIFHIPYDAGLYIFALIVAAYVIAGGLKGVMFTDALQGAIMLVGMLILVACTYYTLGGFTAAHQALTDMSDLVPKGLTAIGHQGWTSMPKFGWASPGDAPAAAAQYNLWWIMVSTIVLGVGIGVLAQPQLVVRFMTVKSRKSLNRAVVVGGVFILAMTGVAFVVGSLSNAYFHRNEVIPCQLVNEQALLDPGADGAGRLTPVALEASAETKARAKAFVSYRLPGETEENALRYVLKTPGMVIRRGENGGLDQIEPHLISIARSITVGTTMKGNTDTIVPIFVGSAMPKWFGIIFLMSLLSAAMSTLSSQFHTMGTAVGRDIFEQITHRHSRHSVLITRLGILVGLIAAITMGKLVRGNIIALATALFFGLCASSFLPMLLGGLFWKRMTRVGAISSILVGFLGSTFWSVFINAKTAGGLGFCMALTGKATLIPSWASPTWAVVDPLIVSLPISLLVAVIVSLCTKPLTASHVKYCYGGIKSE
ncbi:MAG: sodium:solute symporter family protein [Kiritimatiellae bacterium]|nr:sodium:solute symporter family protein [Kiritimatiellia bacterium]MDD4734768.1 sodium:solute symporter family protein [Kiritimatiellia bacterium]